MHSQISYLMSLAVESIQKGDLNGAERLLRQSLVMAPKNSEAFRLLGVVFAFKGNFQEALKSLDKAIKLDPNHWLAHSNRGNVLKDLNQFEAALKSYDKTIALQPNYAEAHNNKGNAFQELKRYQDAVKSYDQAIALQPSYAEAYSNAGNALKKLNLLDLALIAYEKALELGDQSGIALSGYLSTKMQLCDWSGIQELLNQVENGDIPNKERFYPFNLFFICTSPWIIQEITQAYMSSENPAKIDLGSITKSKKNEKIRLGYFSADFRNHAVSHLMAGVLECHDKEKFELVAFSMGSNESDDMRERLKASFDQFIDVSSKSDREVAQLARNLNIDIAIDLGGLTQNSRPKIFAYRAAPIQVGYIGYLGTMASYYFDYIIADETIIPPELREAYTEKIIYLPSYQANDPKRKIAERVFTRQEFGIPSNSFIYCCFNNNYKFTPSIVDSWAKILLQVGESVILLYAENDTVKRNLLAEFEARGIREERVFFAERMPLAEYLARYRIADLFLDTSPYNAGTTASDALWAGLPVITFLGETFSARMGGSLLNAIGLPELVCHSQNEYEDLAIDLGKNREKLGEMKDRLAKNRLAMPLFDTPLFTRNLEIAYEKVYERYQDDLSPIHIF